MGPKHRIRAANSCAGLAENSNVTGNLVPPLAARHGGGGGRGVVASSAKCAPAERYKIQKIHNTERKQKDDGLTSSPKVGEGPQLIVLSSAATIILLFLQKQEEGRIIINRKTDATTTDAPITQVR